MRQKLLFRKDGMKILTLSIFSFMLLLIGQNIHAQTITANSQNTHNGFFYSFWTERPNDGASMTLGPDGNYSTTWNNTLNFTAGKGWKVGSASRVVCFEGTYNGGSNGFLALYGWTKNPLIEYYVCEKHGQWEPPGNTSGVSYKGTYTCDGGTYKVYTGRRVDKPSIVGNATFDQYWSVRQEQRSTGTITFSSHIEAWASFGMQMGTTWDYQIMESEGYNSSGSSNITVKECVSCNATAPTVTATVSYEQGDVANQLTASGTNLKWYNSASSTTPLASAPTPSTATTGTTSYFVSQTPGNCESPKSEIKVIVSNIYKIFKVSTPITIDGVVDAAWNDANVLPMNATKLLSGTVSNPADLSGSAKVVWDDNYLYVFATVTDDTKIQDSDDTYNDDNVEFYIDINNDKASEYGNNDAQYSFRWDDGTSVGALPDGRSVAGIEYTLVATTNGYVVEGRIPWTTVQGNPSADQLIGLDFMINDDDDGTDRDAKLSWNAAEDQAWTDPSLFGTAKLVETEIITSMSDFSTTSISIYPNPTTGTLFIEGFDNSFEYTLIDNTSRTLQTGESENKIDFSTIENGLYNLMIQQGDFKKTIKVLIAN